MPRLLLLVLLASTLVACVERRLMIRTEPEGATVRVNGEEVGTSPVEWRFHHYGTVLVEVELEGHEPVHRPVHLRSPWYQKPGLDFFSDVLLPARIRDDHEVTIELVADRRLTDEEVDEAVRAVSRAARERRADAEKAP